MEPDLALQRAEYRRMSAAFDARWGIGQCRCGEPIEPLTEAELDGDRDDLCRRCYTILKETW
jgi:hypothetical protein